MQGVDYRNQYNRALETAKHDVAKIITFPSYVLVVFIMIVVSKHLPTSWRINSTPNILKTIIPNVHSFIFAIMDNISFFTFSDVYQNWLDGVFHDIPISSLTLGGISAGFSLIIGACFQTILNHIFADITFESHGIFSSSITYVLATILVIAGYYVNIAIKKKKQKKQQKK